MSVKKQLGQFYTTNYDYILQGMKIPKDVNIIIEPFAGKGDLLSFIDTKKYILECYDIDPKQNWIKHRDTLRDPPDYNNKFVLTNPPYLARNKSKSKDLFDIYSTNDLYKCFIEELIVNNACGGIIIIPLNFWCSIRTTDVNLRKRFLKVYKIEYINIFEEQVFNDTSYTICSVQFTLSNKHYKIKTTIYPSNTELSFELNKSNNYTIGGEIYKLSKNKKIKIERLTKNNLYTKKEYITNIFLKCIDDSKKNKISLSLVDDDKIYVDNTPNLSARSYASLIIEPILTIEQQKLLISKFNKYIKDNRVKYHSLFLTNYRESVDISRKRISFTLAFDIVNHLLNDII
jgi:hypothetical protein